MNATQRMKWYWSGGMIGILIILIALLKLFGSSSVPPISPVSDAHLPFLSAKQVEIERVE